MLRSTVIFVGTLLLGLSGCGDRRSCPRHRGTCEPPPTTTVDSLGSSHQWVVDSIRFPSDAATATAYGLNLDGDEFCREDNAIGQVLAAFFGGNSSEDINPAVRAQILSGRLIHLIDIRATALDNAAGVGVTFYNGIDTDADPTNNLGGDGTFTIDETATSFTLGGHIKDGRLVANLGSVPLTIALSETQEPELVTLHGAVVDATIDGATVTGKLGGSLFPQQVDEQLLPAIAALIAEWVERDCSGTAPNCCDDGTIGASVVGFFDTDPIDCEVSLAEITSSNLIKSLLTVDVDLYDGDGRHNPLCDGVKESMSFGVSFTAVRATF